MNIISQSEAKELGLKRYFTGKPCLRLHISERGVSGSCIECAKERKREEYQINKQAVNERCRAYYAANKDKISATGKQYYKENKAKVNAANKKWQEDNKDKVRADAKNHRLKNKDRINAATKQWREDNPSKALASSRSWQARNPLNAFVRNSLSRLQSNWSGGRERYEELLGYSYGELKTHLEGQFLSGMGWHNRSEWHIDHIKPVSVFLREGVSDPVIVNALSNLQPLWAKDNFSKGCRVNTLPLVL